MSFVIKRKLEGEVEIHSAAADVYHDIYKSKPHHVSHVSPHFVESCDLLEGDLGTPGSVICWKYTLGGKTLISKNKIEAIDEEKKMVRQRVIEGDILKQYKYVVITGHVTPKDKETSIVKWSFEYEKLDPGMPDPTDLLDGLMGAAQDTEDHHKRQKQIRIDLIV